MMKTIFNAKIREDVIARIHALHPDSKGTWGKMNIYQMLKHCRNWSDWIHGTGDFANHRYKQDFFGKLLGTSALKKLTKDDRVMGRNAPAGFLAVKDKQRCDIFLEKDKWKKSIKDYEHYSNDRFVHDFFGRMTKEQIGILVYKHFDHHLRQFGV